MTFSYARISIPARALRDPQLAPAIQRILGLREDEIREFLAEPPDAEPYSGISDQALRLVDGQPFLVLEDEEPTAIAIAGDQLCALRVPHHVWHDVAPDALFSSLDAQAIACFDGRKHVITTDRHGHPVVRYTCVGPSPHVDRKRLAGLRRYARAAAAITAYAADHTAALPGDLP